MIVKHSARIRAALIATLLTGAGLSPVAGIATPNSYEECVAKLFRTDACAGTGWWTDSTCQMKTLAECSLP